MYIQDSYFFSCINPISSILLRRYSGDNYVKEIFRIVTDISCRYIYKQAIRVAGIYPIITHAMMINYIEGADTSLLYFFFSFFFIILLFFFYFFFLLFFLFFFLYFSFSFVSFFFFSFFF